MHLLQQLRNCGSAGQPQALDSSQVLVLTGLSVQPEMHVLAAHRIVGERDINDSMLNYNFPWAVANSGFPMFVCVTKMLPGLPDLVHIKHALLLCQRALSY